MSLVQFGEKEGKMQKIYICFPEGKTKALTMSYDDGRTQDERLIDIFNQYGIKGTFNLNYGIMQHDNMRIPAERVKELYSGHEVATHTLMHPTIERCPLSETAYEILEDRKGLEMLTGGIVRGHAYPNGSYNKEIKQLFRQLGIAYGRVVEAKPDFALPSDPMEWHPTCHHNASNLMELAEYFANFQKRQYLKLMYVWGHSYEFDQAHNWEVIETFCRYISGRNDIWYATNIEIIDYMEAAKNLRFTADNTEVYNPSAQSVWIQTNDKGTVEIEGGKISNLHRL